ncbi:hypothetical protein PHYPSEUDO_007718 [Phytophthora pseudosyringae]|uniref:Uncharacterized protein n=1 Tax=Phytophthora pseudosyringae TaxID=221518 RepID=A0A8T1W930_9STRA|nr:hypothetical protein PHYPSEUDO_007718 [Phytophthora pseudosyringae]
MEVQAPAGRPPLTIITNLSQQQTKASQAKQIHAAVHSHAIVDNKLLRSRTLSPSSRPTSASTAPPTPAIVNVAKLKTFTPTSTPTAAARSRAYKYCSDPDCASPLASDAESSRATEPATARTTPTSVTSGPHVSTMNTDTYFKLLKKSQVLEHLVQLSSHVGESEQQVRRLQCEQARSQCVQDRVFAELERYRRQVVDAQHQFLGLIEALTALCIREEKFQVSTTDEAEGPETHGAVSAEEQTLLDLQRATSPTAKSSSGSTLETQALATVGRQRVQQLEAICARYERQLVGSEAALSQAIYSDAARESVAKIAQLEARNQLHEADKQALQVQLELARGQVTHLQGQLTQTQERRTTLEHVKQQLEQELTRHTTATQRFASDLQTELRRRYGVVPSVLELKWHNYFPRLSRPF